MALAFTRNLEVGAATAGAAENRSRLVALLTEYHPEVPLLFFAAALTFFGRSLIGHWSTRYIGMGHDPDLFFLFFEWWRYALVNHLNPFHLSVVWAPVGFNLAMTTSVPLAAFALMPIEATAGPVAAYNVAILLCPALSAWAAFVLCRYLTKSYWPSLVAGYLFGFSPYMLCHLLGHLTLVMVFFVPLSLYLILRWLDGELTDRRLVTLLTLSLAGQFLSSLEILAAMTAVGGFAWLISYAFGESRLRARLLGLLPRAGVSYLLTAMLMSPYLYYFFAGGQPDMASGWARMVSARPLHLLIPQSTNILGSWKVFRSLTNGPVLWETGEYVGVPLLLVWWSFTRSRWKELGPWLLSVLAILLFVATLGPELYLGRQGLAPLPWRIVSGLPMVRMILPARLSVYLFLVLAMIAAMWLSDARLARRVRLGAGLALAGAFLPNLSAGYWTIAVDTPKFFADGTFRKYLSPNESVLVFPYGYWGDSQAWLASTRMSFRLAGGYVGILPPVPDGFAEYPIVPNLYNLVAIPDAEEQLKAFLVQRNIGAVVVADQGAHLWRPVPRITPPVLERTAFDAAELRRLRSWMTSLGATPIAVDGVTFYRIPLDRWQNYRQVSSIRLQDRLAAMRMAKLIEAARSYVGSGRDLDLLTPLRAQELGMLPAGWVGGVYLRDKLETSTVQDELILGLMDEGRVGVGLFGSREALLALATEYGGFAKKVDLYPPDQRTASAADGINWVLILQFDHAGLAAAGSIADRATARATALFVP